MSVLFNTALSSVLLPPLLFVLPALLGVLLAARGHRRIGHTLAACSLTLLTLCSMPAVGERMLRLLEPRALSPSLTAESPTGAAEAVSPTRETPQAIVVLGGGLAREAPEYGGDAIGSSTLERLRYGARLHRHTGLPILVSGGRPLGTPRSEADTMVAALAADFRLSARWAEDQSLNTAENAQRSRELLAAAGITDIYLVTHAWHMPRARRAFERAGFTVTAAPTGYTSLTPGARAWIPSAEALRKTHIALREWLGAFWYRLNS